MTAKTAYHRTLLAIMMIVMSLASIATPQAINHKLSDDEIKHALQIATEVRSMREKEKTAELYPVPRSDPYAQGGAYRWYNRLSFNNARYNAIGKLFIVPLAMKAPRSGKFELADDFGFGDCTAFYVAKDILATAAHCLRDNGVTPESKHVIIFRQQYDGTAAYNDNLAKKFERVVVDWWYLAAYNKKEGEAWNHWSGFDYAFLRTNKHSYEDAAYALAEPDPYLAKQLEVAGYPAEYADYFEPVSIDCKLLQGTATEVTRDPGVVHAMQDDASAPSKINGAMVRKPKTQCHMKDIVDNQLFCLGRKGNMGAGGSGGPWLVHDAEIQNDPQGIAKLRTVVGIQSWSLPRLGLVAGFKSEPRYATAFKNSQHYAKASVTAWIKPETMFIYNAIREAKAGVAMAEAVTAAVKKETKLVKIAEQLMKLLKL